MLHQTSFARAEFAAQKKTTRRETFLARMDEVIPWAKLLAVLEPFYPKGQRGRPPLVLERMRRVYFLQQWYGLADEALADALYDSQALQGFARLDLAARGLLLRAGTLVDAPLIAAPPSTQNKAQQRDPERHQTKQGNQWCFGMKAHSGADRDSKLVPTVVVPAANVAAVTKPVDLLHGQETQGPADAGYTGVAKRAEIVALGRAIDWQIACQRSLIKVRSEVADILEATAGTGALGPRSAGFQPALATCAQGPSHPPWPPAPAAGRAGWKPALRE